MDKKSLKDRLQYEIENGDSAFLNYVNEAVETYRLNNVDSLVQLPPHIEELVEISLKQAENGEGRSWDEFITEQKKLHNLI